MSLIPVNNPLERIMKEIRRRTRVVGAFPDGQSCLNLAAARLRYIAGMWLTSRTLVAGTWLRIPAIVTTRSDGSRPPVPIDRDQFDGAVRCIF